MIPKILCGACGAPIVRGDKFCSACGAVVEWNDAGPLPERSPGRQSPAGKGAGGNAPCRSCGQQNPPGARVCASCGSVLGKPDRGTRKGTPEGARLAGMFQSWKPLAAVALLLAAAVFLARTFRSGPGEPAASAPPAGQSIAAPQQEALNAQIASLQKSVDDNPGDAPALLRLANALYDARQFPRAVTSYAAYLAANPGNADARVDMAIGYFEMSFVDTLRRTEYLLKAKREMETAVRYAPNHQLAYFNLGIVSFHTGEDDSAVAWFKKCIAVDPSNETARRAQQFLDQHKITTRPLR